MTETDSPGGGPPGKGVGGIFPCWNAAAVEKKKAKYIKTHKHTTHILSYKA